MSKKLPVADEYHTALKVYAAKNDLTLKEATARAIDHYLTQQEDDE